MLPQIFPVLNVSAVTAFVGTSPARIYRHGAAPQNVTAPYITWFVGGGAPENTFGGAEADQFRVQVDCWSDSDAQIEQLAEAVRTAMEPHAHLVAYVANERDFQTQRYRIGMAFDWWSGR